MNSMTAYADHETAQGPYALRWEIRSVNSRYLDLILRLPENLRFLEPDIRRLLGDTFKRGKLECNLKLEPAPDASFAFELNEPLVHAVIAAIGQISPLLADPAQVSPLDIAKWPGALREPESNREELAKAALQCLGATCEKLADARRREGQKLAAFIQQRRQLLEQQVEEARKHLPEALETLRTKITSRLQELSAEPDPNRLEQELVYLAQKLDVAEELDRLQAHLSEIDRLLKADQPIGRRLDFLCQEMNREANTLASKAASTDLTQCSIEMKVLIEQIREQVQNIE